MRAAVGELCLVLLRQQRREDAQAPCRRAIRGWGRDHGVDIRHISTYAEEMKDYGLALAATEQGLVDEPMSRYHRSDRTRILNAMGRDADALRLLREYVAAHASDWEAVEEMAEQMFWTGDVAGARAQYVRLLHPACGESRAGCSVDGRIAMASLRLGKVDDAFRELRATLETSPTCYYNVDQFQRFAAMRPDSATVLPRLRRMLDEVGEHVATHADPSDAAAWFGARGRWDRATPLLRIALDSALAEERRPNSGRRSYELRRRYGESLVAEGKYCEGLRELEASITVQPLVPGAEPYIPDALRLARERCPENRR
jgi:tetratricopeptide (TPR) repeat protein